jgi:hypothetical protein
MRKGMKGPRRGSESGPKSDLQCEPSMIVVSNFADLSVHYTPTTTTTCSYPS